MAATPKAKPSPAPSPTPRPDRTSTVVTGTLILLTVLGVVTVFWEPLAALASGAPAADSMGEARPSSADGGAGAAPSPSVTGGTTSSAGARDASASS